MFNTLQRNTDFPERLRRCRSTYYEGKRGSGEVVVVVVMVVELLNLSLVEEQASRCKRRTRGHAFHS